MIELRDRVIHEDGTVILTPQAALEAIYANGDLGSSWIEPCADAELYQRANQLLDLGLERLKIGTDPQLSDAAWQSTWWTPEPYAGMDVLGHCTARCINDDQLTRVCEEYKLFEARGMIPTLRHLCYLVDHWRESGVVWGVGRGSSVSSYILYLIGINRIDPLQFDLDIGEFLK